MSDGRSPPSAAELFAGVPVAVLVVDPGGLIAEANMLAEELLNLSWRMMRGQTLTSVLPDLASRRELGDAGRLVHDTEIATTRGSVRADLIEAAIPGREGWRMVALHQLSDDRGFGHAAGRVGTRAATGAAAMLAHEIKNPLSGIRGAAQLAAAGELTTLIVTEVDRIAALIDRMQDLSDTRPLALGPANIYPLLGHARDVALAGFARGIDIDERYDPSLPEAQVNPDALVQVLINLLRNACEAVSAEPRPRVTIATAYRHGTAGTSPQGERRGALPIEIGITDNGPGAPPDIADNLFDPFVSSRRGGRGLGLALVDKLVSDMGGIVRYTRDEVAGLTTLRLRLPRARA